MKVEIEVLWLQMHVPHLKPILIGCCYRPLRANSSSVDVICDILDCISIFGLETHFIGDLYIDWCEKTC